MEELNIFTKINLIAVLVKNDVQYLHWLAKGKDFDKSHLLTKEYYEQLAEECDYLTELTIEQGYPIINPSKALEFIEEYPTEEAQEYNYQEVVSVLKDKLTFYMDSLNDLREECGVSSIESKLDDMVRYWEKEVNYKLERRTDEEHHHMLDSFINTGLDQRIAGLYSTID